jgi:ribose transport system permease protein
VSEQRRTLNLGLDRFSGFYLWALAILIFGIWKPHLFLTQATLHSVASSQAIGAMLAIAVLVPLAAGAFDLSIGATINLSAIIVAWLQSAHHWNMWPAMFIAVGATFLVGVVNGFIVVKLRINSFIATLGMATVVAAVQTIVSGNSQPLPPTAAAWNSLTQRTVGGFQIVVLYLVIAAVFFWWLLEHTPAGRYSHATGGNQEAARLAGVRVDYWTWLTLIVSATVAGIAGVLYSSLSGPSLSFGSTLLLPAFAAAFLGSTQLKPGRFNVWGTMLAVYVLATGVKGLELVTGVQWLNDMFNGVALIVAVGFAVWRQRSAASRRRATASQGAPEADSKGEAAEVAGASTG